MADLASLMNSSRADFGPLCQPRTSGNESTIKLYTLISKPTTSVPTLSIHHERSQLRTSHPDFSPFPEQQSSTLP